MIDLTNLKTTQGFADVPLSIISTQEVGDYYEYNAQGTLENAPLGMIIRLKKGILAGLSNPKNLFLTEGIEFISKGKESDLLLNFLATLYDLNKAALTLKDFQVFTCANLNNEDVNYKNGACRFKIFLEEEETYAELFVNFDFSEKTITLSEKDEM